MSSPEKTNHVPPAPEVAAIEAEIEGARARVAASMQTLGDQVSRMGDWTAYVREHPLLALGLALGGGYIVGGGLFAPLSKTLLRTGVRLGVQLALVPALEREVANLAAKAGRSSKADDAEGGEDV